MGFESYVVYRMSQLVELPQSFHLYKVSDENQKRFCDSYTESMKPAAYCNALPSDSEIIGGLFAGFLDTQLATNASIPVTKFPPHLLSL